MNKAELFLYMLARDFDFSHGGIDDKQRIFTQLLELAGLKIIEIGDSGHSEHDQYVIGRAKNNADKPYDQDTCARYPWAAAARITYLEGVISAIKG